MFSEGTDSDSCQLEIKARSSQNHGGAAALDDAEEPAKAVKQRRRLGIACKSLTKDLSTKK